MYDLDWLKSFYNGLNNPNGVVTSLECGASEPTMHPQIKDILTILQSHGTVSVPTNNSINPNRWLPADGRNIFARCALHPQNEENIDKFRDRILEMKQHGVDAICCFCATPDRIEKIERLKEYFNNKGILIRINAFNGVYNGKKYPDSYTENEINKIYSHDEEKGWYDRIQPYLIIKDFSSIPCFAGKYLMYISPSTIQKCLYDPAPIHEIETAATPCRVKNCGCGLFLEELNSWMQSGDVSNDVFFQQQLKKYFSLMINYDKLDFNKIRKIYNQ